MAEGNPDTQYDDVLLSILSNEKSILGFLSSIFNFLGRRTDFYFVPEGPNDNLGFPPGEAEKLVIKIMRSCDPKSLMADNNNTSSGDAYDAIMCSTVAKEVEICDEESINNDDDQVASSSSYIDSKNDAQDTVPPKITDEHMPQLPAPMKSECYNGAERENYVWSQTIVDLDVTVKLPDTIKSSKDIKVTINPGDISVLRKSTGEVIVKDTFPHKVKAIESFWSISGQQLNIHLEKHEERWWKSLLSSEEEIDLTKIDSSRQLYDLPESHIAKIHEMQWNQEQKLKGLPTSDEIKNMEILKKAWNVEGSPFKGTEFDPSIFSNK